jgi:uncharacterized protein (UPF0332 family)
MLSFTKYSATIAAFGKEFIKSDIFPVKFHQFILEAFDLRNIGDYGAMYSVNNDKAKELIQKAKEIIKAIQEYIF